MTRLIAAAVFSVLVLGSPVFGQQPPPAVAAPPPAPLRMAFVDLQRVAAESVEGKASTAKVQALSQKKAIDLLL